MKELRRIRRAKDITQEELGQRVGLSAAAISAFERGEANPRQDTLVSLADALDVAVDELLGRLPKKAGVPTVGELLEATKTIERLISQCRAFIVRWEEEGVKDLEEATCLSFVFDRANEQIYRDLQAYAPADVVIERRGEMSDELVDAAYRRVNAYSRLSGVAAEARNVAAQLSQDVSSEAAEGLERLFALKEAQA